MRPCLNWFSVITYKRMLWFVCVFGLVFPSSGELCHPGFIIFINIISIIMSWESIATIMNDNIYGELNFIEDLCFCRMVEPIPRILLNCTVVLWSNYKNCKWFYRISVFFKLLIK